jgi:AcrR family transcriptional regulator
MNQLDEREADAPSRRERKKRATSLALKAAALDLVAERGFTHVTVEDICDVVDVSARTFFNYFSSKEAAVVGDDPELIEAMKRELIALPRELSPLEALRSVLCARIRAIEEDIDLSGEDHRVWQRRFAVVRSQPEVLVAYTKHLTRVEGALTDALVERLGGDEGMRVYASIVAATVLGAMRVAGTWSSTDEGSSSLLHLANEAFELLTDGLRFDAGRAHHLGRCAGARAHTP